jgi:hypothetical protein
VFLDRFRHYVCISLETRRRTVDGIDVGPLVSFLRALWDGEYA